MPNWCNNSVTFTHPEPAQLQRLVDAYNAGHTMQEFWPCPDDLRNTVAGALAPGPEQTALEQRQRDNLDKYGAKDWYDWCCDNWGVKWDFGRDGDDYPKAEVQTKPDGTLYVALGFDTAWSPPLGFYAHMHELGFDVKAYYFEMGMGFCGVSRNGDERTIKICEFTQDWLADNVPHSICEAFNLYEQAAEQEEAEREWLEQQNNPGGDSVHRPEAI